MFQTVKAMLNYSLHKKNEFKSISQKKAQESEAQKNITQEKQPQESCISCANFLVTAFCRWQVANCGRKIKG